MAEIIKRDDKLYCVEEDGTEWEYTPPEIMPPLEEPPTPEQMKIAQLEQQLVQTNTDLQSILEMVLFP